MEVQTPSTEATAILSAIDKLVESRTFSLDGLEGIKALRDHAETLAKANDTLTRRDAGHVRDIQSLEQQARGLREKVAKTDEREAAVKVRENKMHQLETASAVASAKADTLHSVFNTIFKNTIVRETVAGNISRSGPGGYTNDGTSTLSTRETD